MKQASTPGVAARETAPREEIKLRLRKLRLEIRNGTRERSLTANTSQSSAPPVNDTTPSYLWVGRFEREDKAQNTAKKIQDLGLPVVVVPRHGLTGEFYVVVTGPYGPERIESAMDYLKTQGFSDVRLIKNPLGNPRQSPSNRIRRFEAGMTDGDGIRGAERHQDVSAKITRTATSSRRSMNLFVLSDGMGGLEVGRSGEPPGRGRRARAAAAKQTTNPSICLSPANASKEFPPRRTSLASAIRFANESVYRAAQQGAGHRGMGATIVAVQCTDQRMSVAHVGDSRIYRLRGGKLEQLTGDHSFVAEQVRNGKMTAEEADSSTMQNVLIRALGVDPAVEVDLTRSAADGGRHGAALLRRPDARAFRLADCRRARRKLRAQTAAARLVDLAKQAGGGDNVTVIVLRCVAKPRWRALARIGKWFTKSA